MKNQRYVYALPKPDIDTFELPSLKPKAGSDESNKQSKKKSKKVKKPKKKKTVVADDSDEDDIVVIDSSESDAGKVKKKHGKKSKSIDSDEDSDEDEDAKESSSTDSSSSEEDIQISDGVLRISKRKRDPSSANSKENKNKQTTVVESESDSDEDIPLLDLEQYTKNDPSMQKVREANKLLLKKRQEILDQEKDIRARAARAKRAAQISSQADGDVEEFKFARSSSQRTLELLQESDAIVDEKRKLTRAASEEKQVQSGVKIKFRLPRSDPNARKDNFLEIVVVPTSPFEEAFAKVRQHLGQGDVSFVFEGERMTGNETAEGEDMEAGDIIDVAL